MGIEGNDKKNKLFSLHPGLISDFQTHHPQNIKKEEWNHQDNVSFHNQSLIHL